MNRVAAVACSLTLAGCGSFSSIGDYLPTLPGAGGGYPITLESDPPGAEARTSLGPVCRTPCTLSVPAREAFTVTFAFAGYEAQTVEVNLMTSGGLGGEVTTSVQFAPNPVFAQLEPAAGPPPVKKPAKGKPRSAAKPAPAPSAASGPSASDIPASQRTIPGAQPTVPTPLR